MNLRIGTYNIQSGKFFAHRLETGETVINLDNIAKLIRDEEIEICGLQEVCNQTFQNAPRGEQAKIIGEKLGYYYMFAKAICKQGIPENEYGVGLVSKYPIVSCYTIPVALAPEKKTDPKAFYEDRVVMVANLTVEGKPLTVINTHFGLVPGERLLSIEAVKEEMKKIKNPVVLMGDFNLMPDSHDYELLTEIPNLNDVAALMGDKMLPNTFPSHTHVKKIDYLFTSDEIKVKNADVAYVMYADHLPYIMNIEW